MPSEETFRAFSCKHNMYMFDINVPFLFLYDVIRDTVGNLLKF